MIAQPSRYLQQQVFRTSAGNLEHPVHEPYVFRELSDTRLHVARAGDTLHTIAAAYYTGASNPARLWWVIADFQPDPIVDPLAPLATGRVLYVPSQSVLISEILPGTRFLEAELA